MTLCKYLIIILLKSCQLDFDYLIKLYRKEITQNHKLNDGDQSSKVNESFDSRIRYMDRPYLREDFKGTNLQTINFIYYDYHLQNYILGSIHVLNLILILI